MSVIDEELDMTHILLPFDGSNHARKAVDHVLARARQGGPLKVTLLNVQELPYMHGDETVVSMTDSIGRNVIEAGKRLLTGPAEKLKAAGAEVAMVVECDDPARAIAQQAAAGCDEIVMGTRGLGRFGEMMLGSVAYKTVHLVQVPVTLVK